MRKFLLVASLILATGNVTFAAMPYLANTDASATATSNVEPKSFGWKLPRLWGKKKKPNPKLMYSAPTPPPTTTQRITSAMTDNPVVNTTRKWFAPKSDSKPQKPDPISLSQPTGKPTPELMVSLAQMREKQGDVTTARTLYQQALAAGPKNVKTLREIGHFEDRQGNMDDAERFYNEAANLQADNPALLNDLALCLARQNRTAQAAEVLNRAIQLAPSKPLYRNNMATVLMELGDQHGAMQHLLAVHAPASAYYNMGHLLDKATQTEAAKAHYAEALRLDPAMSPAQEALARLSQPATTHVAQTSMAPTTPSVPQTAMVPTTARVPHTAMIPAAATQPVAAQAQWPSEPIAPARPSTMATPQPNFGPRLLPPVE